MILRAGYDALLLDLDGTLYVGAHAVPGAAAALAGDMVEGSGQRLLYVTNNASRGPETVAEHLRELGFPAIADDVVTSAQAAAGVLARRLAPGSAVLVVGTDALAAEIAAVGLRPVRSADERPKAVVQGHNPDTGWAMLAEASFAIRAGADWVATNTDATLPTERGLAPGNGSMVAAVRAATDRSPDVAGKPARPIMIDSLNRAGAQRALVVGDRLDTDIAGANAAEVDSLLVLTGVSTVRDLLRAPVEQRPSFVAFALDAINRPIERAAAAGRAGWRAEFDGTDVLLSRSGGVESAADGLGDDAAGLAAAVATAWANPEFGELRPLGPAAAAALRRWEEQTVLAGPAVPLVPGTTEIG